MYSYNVLNVPSSIPCSRSQDRRTFRGPIQESPWVCRPVSGRGGINFVPGTQISIVFKKCIGWAQMTRRTLWVFARFYIYFVVIKSSVCWKCSTVRSGGGEIIENWNIFNFFFLHFHKVFLVFLLLGLLCQSETWWCDRII